MVEVEVRWARASIAGRGLSRWRSATTTLRAAKAERHAEAPPRRRGDNVFDNHALSSTVVTCSASPTSGATVRGRGGAGVHAARHQSVSRARRAAMARVVVPAAPPARRRRARARARAPRPTCCSPRLAARRHALGGVSPRHRAAPHGAREALHVVHAGVRDRVAHGAERRLDALREVRFGAPSRRLLLFALPAELAVVRGLAHRGRRAHPGGHARARASAAGSRPSSFCLGSCPRPTSTRA